MIRVFSILAIMFFVSCDEDADLMDDGFDESLSEVYESTIPDTVSVNNVFSITMKHYGSDGCAQYAKTEKEKNGNNLNLVVYQKKEKSRVCPQAIISIKTTFNYSFSSKGKKYIRFNEVNHLVDSVYVK